MKKEHARFSIPNTDKDLNTRPMPENLDSKPRPKSVKQFGRVSKFKHLKGDVMLKGKFDNLKNLSRTVPAECNFIHGKRHLIFMQQGLPLIKRIYHVPNHVIIFIKGNFVIYLLANANRIAVPLEGPGGKVAIFETAKPGRIPDGVLPVLINGTTVMDFGFDPSDNGRLITGCDDG